MRPGDVLLYKPGKSIFSIGISIKTWSRISHCEAYVGEDQTVASRDGKGVAVYPFQTDRLVYVLRPTRPFDLEKAMEWFWTSANGQKYDWLGLIAFFLAKYQGKENGKMFCSEFLTRWYRAGGLDPFNGYDADGIAPVEFVKTPAFEIIYRG